MSRSLSHLSRLSSTSNTTALLRRYHSTQPESKSKEEVERAALKKLEEAIHRLIVKKAQPDWLPLVPGGSYWVPPKSTSLGFAQVVAKLVKDSNGREIVKDDQLFYSNRGWPSSAQFFIGASHSPLEGDMTFKHSNKSEDEEG